MKITVFPALNGDSILIEYAETHCILIDGGYVDTFDKYLQPKLIELAEMGKTIDLLVVTHIDADHISGIIRMLETQSHIIPINNIWYNGYRHIQNIVTQCDVKETIIHRSIDKRSPSSEAKQISARQGCTLSALIQKNGLSWNTQFNGEAVMAPATVNIECAKFHLLSPDQDSLVKLCKFWRKELIKNRLLSKAHSFEFWDDAFEYMMAGDKPGFHFHTKRIDNTSDIEKIKNSEYNPDNSPTNGSSISFILDCEDMRLLFLGDAHAETVVKYLNSLNEKSLHPLIFDAVKLSHHGSCNNNSPELINTIDSGVWIVSTNGDSYNHPDKETLCYIISKDKSNQRNIYFNYKLPICKEIDCKAYHEVYKYSVHAPSDNQPLELLF